MEIGTGGGSLLHTEYEKPLIVVVVLYALPLLKCNVGLVCAKFFCLFQIEKQRLPTGKRCSFYFTHFAKFYIVMARQNTFRFHYCLVFAEAHQK